MMNIREVQAIRQVCVVATCTRNPTLNTEKQGEQARNEVTHKNGMSKWSTVFKASILFSLKLISVYQTIPDIFITRG